MSDALTIPERLRIYAATCPPNGKVELALPPDEAVALARILERMSQAGYFIIERPKPMSRFEEITYAFNWAVGISVIASWILEAVMP